MELTKEWLQQWMLELTQKFDDEDAKRQKLLQAVELIREEMLKLQGEWRVLEELLAKLEKE